MTQHLIQHIFPFDKQQKAKIDCLLQKQHIRRDPHLDYTCAIIDEQGEPIATGSLYGNSLRCLAVDQAYQGQGLLNQIVSHLIEEAYSRGHYHLFVYTKLAAAPLLLSLGFHVIAMVDDTLCFLENKKKGFENYLSQLEKPQVSPQKTAAIVLNANPFTLGHLYLIEKACADNELVHLFMVSQDSSLIPYYIRKELIIKGTAHLANIIYHDSGPYMISQATFPAYFQKDELAVIDIVKLNWILSFSVILQKNSRSRGVMLAKSLPAWSRSITTLSCSSSCLAMALMCRLSLGKPLQKAKSSAPLLPDRPSRTMIKLS